MKKAFLMISFMLSIQFFSIAQLVTSVPVFPVENLAVDIYFDASQGNQGLMGYTGDVYAHTGVITNLSTTSSDWRYVKTNWGQNTPETKLTNVGSDLWKLSITPDIRSYYAVPSSEQILKIALVFRSGVQVGGSYLEGKTATGGDIFVDVYQSGLNVIITNPDQQGLILELNDQFLLEASATESDSMSLYIDNVLIQQTSDTFFSYNVTGDVYGKHKVKVFAWNTLLSTVDSIYYFVRPPVTVEDLPIGVQDGINYIDDQTVILVLYAPEKQYAFVKGDFSDWELDTTVYMKRTTDGLRYWLQLDNLIPQKEYIYQYLIDGNIVVADPYSEKISDPWNDSYISQNTYPDLINYPVGKTSGIATVISTAQPEYNWNIADFQAPEKANIIVYELLVRDFTTPQNFIALADTIGYLKTLGINVIELMPVNEFEGNLSWGYNPDFYFAHDKYYGTSQAYKHFIDIAHQNGIAVVMDIALNHSFGQSPMVQMYWDDVNGQPAQNNPWYNPIPKHDFNVGYDFNHESQATKYFVCRVLKHWLIDYKVDGFRLDLSKGFTQNNTLGNTSAWANYDASRIAILENYADSVWSYNSVAYVILEHFADNSEETVLADYGMLLWGNGNYNYNEATMGWNTNSNFSWCAYTSRGWTKPHLVSFMESHDEERLMAKNLEYGNSGNSAYNIKNLDIALGRMELAANFFITIPGPKMIWQFGELAYDYCINYPGTIGGTDHRMDSKPIRWDYYNVPARNRVFNVFRCLNELKKTEPAFSSESFSLSVSGAMKRINIYDPTMDVVIIGNFDIYSGNIDPNFSHQGIWYSFFTGDSLTVSDIHTNILLNPGEYRLYTTKKFEVPNLWTTIQDININNFKTKLFPNPTSNHCNLEFTIQTPEKVKVTITYINGNLVKTVCNQNFRAGKHEFLINFTENKLVKGIYFVNISNNNFTESKKLIVQ